eukprot:TRINITY_DN1775_c0_g1_i1.p1 TRINITY_DN1775_c0_g1~~TRINITY_DN1775_c0_g1_i1.p1  ORF type:complete len:712 (+),score=98.13 TRINITY_DN1775_c0_g1_i1:175-2136(+)
MAFVRLERLLMPRIRMWLAANMKKSESSMWEAEGVVSMLAGCPLLSNWPAESLRRLYQGVKPASYLPNDVINETGSLVILYEGTVIAPSATPKPIKIQAPCLLGGDNLFSEDPVAAAYTAVGSCRAGVIMKRAILREAEKLPKELQDAMWPGILEARQMIVEKHFRLTRDVLRRCCLFENLSDAQLDGLVYRFRPWSVKAGSVIFREGSLAKEMVIVVRGEAEVTSSSTELVQTVTPGKSFGEMGLIFNEHRAAQLKSRSVTDMWCIEASVIKAMFSPDPDFASKISQAAHLQRLNYLSGDVDGKHIEILIKYLKKSPMFRDLRAPDDCFKDLAHLMIPTVTVPGQQIVSAVDVCQQLLLFSKGRAIVRQNISLQNVYIEAGDVIGYTCLAEHRWLFPVTAVTTCDVWRLSKTTLYEVLEKYDLIKAATHMTKKLLMSQGGVPKIARSETDPPLLHPLKGLPQGVGHVMSYEVRPPNEVFASPDVQLKPTPPAKKSYLPASELVRMEGMNSFKGSPRYRRKDLEGTPVDSFLPPVSPTYSSSYKGSPTPSPHPHPPTPTSKGWVLSTATNKRFVPFPLRNFSEAQRGGIPTPTAAPKKAQSVCLPCLPPVPPSVTRRYTARSLTSRTHGSLVPWENSLRAEGPRRGGQGISCL